MQRSPRDCSHEGLGQELPVVASVGQEYREAGQVMISVYSSEK